MRGVRALLEGGCKFDVGNEGIRDWGGGTENEAKRNERNSDSPNPKDNGAKKIILRFDAPERWYADNIHALKTISSVIGACFFCVYVSVCEMEIKGGK